MYRQKYVMFILVALLTFFCLVMAVELVQKKPTIEIIKAVETVETAGLTLLERMYVDLDNDTKDESIELYTSARRGKDGLMEWDDGQRWLLLVRDEGKGFPLFDDYVQSGQIEFWVVNFNKSRITGPNDVDLEKHIYVMNTGNMMKLSDYYWDQNNLHFKEEVVFYPPNQWGIRSSYKYSYDDPALIEPAR